MNRIISTLTSLTIASSACSGAQQDELQQPEDLCEASTRRLNGTLSTVENQVTRVEELQRENRTGIITEEIGRTKGYIIKTVRTLNEQNETMENSCRNRRPIMNDLIGVSGFGIRIASIRSRMQKLDIND